MSMMDLLYESPARRGLRRYLDAVTAQLGLGERCYSLDFSFPANAYVALQRRLARCPEHEVALVWDEHFGWAGAFEDSTPAGLTVFSYLTFSRRTADLLPEPSRVARFAARLFDADQPVNPLPRARPSGRAPRDLAQRLAEYSTAPAPPSPSRG